MSSSDISFLTKKKTLLNNIKIQEGIINFSKDIQVASITCDKLICDDLESRNTSDTNISNAIITNSQIDNTIIGYTTPNKAIFNTVIIKAAGSLSNSFKINSDILINNTTFIDQIRNINSINPLRIFTPQYLQLLSTGVLSIKSSSYINISTDTDINFDIQNKIYFNSNIINIDTSQFYINSQTIFYNSNDSNYFHSASVLFKGGIYLSKNLNLQGHIFSNNSTDSINIFSGALILKGGASISVNKI